MSDKKALLDLLISLPKESFQLERDFAKAIIPQLVSALGYSEAETFYEYRLGHHHRIDVALSHSIETKPWVVIEIKNSKNFQFEQAIQQVNKYLKALDTGLAIIISPQWFLLIKDKYVRQFNLESIQDNDVADIIQIIGREHQLFDAIEKRAINGKLISLIEAVERASSNDEKGKTLEVLAKFLFDNVDSLKCKYTNLQTRSSEIDLLIEYDPSKRKIPLFEELGRYCLVECKNWSKSVGVSPVRDFMGKLDKCKVRLGILLSKNGVTGVDSGADALREIQSRYDRDGVYLLVFSLEELKGISNGIDFLEALDLKADNLRFDT